MKHLLIQIGKLYADGGLRLRKTKAMNIQSIAFASL